ncbi:hypothetical protein ADIS_1227 [Lunatimonas lonarensis]|uniref:Uncharacterized protein n=1 Tax=Lunatimonas lonarensis TaxID=1232681 RepID=R7ZWI2_9BACT|nr:hypothetical protein ADIS_1227 [Lunatimonas lonarensis]
MLWVMALAVWLLKSKKTLALNTWNNTRFCPEILVERNFG